MQYTRKAIAQYCFLIFALNSNGPTNGRLCVGYFSHVLDLP